MKESLKAVYEAWVVYGPGTTRQLAIKSGIDLLTFRPRTTDLCDLGLVELVDSERGSEGIYQAVPETKWNGWHQDHIIGQEQLI